MRNAQSRNPTGSLNADAESPAQDLAGMVATALAMIDAKNVAGAESVLWKVLASRTQLPSVTAQACYGLGLIEFIRRNTHRAEAHLQRALQLVPDHANALYFVARIQILRGATETATATLQQVLRLAPQHGGAKDTLGRLEAVAAARKYGVFQYFVAKAPQDALAQQLKDALDVLETDLKPSAQAVLGYHLSRQLTTGKLAKAVGTIFFIQFAVHTFSFIRMVHGDLSSRTHSALPAFVDPWQTALLSALLFGVGLVWLALFSRAYSRSASGQIGIDGRIVFEGGVFSRERLVFDLTRVRQVQAGATLLQQLTGDGYLDIHTSDGTVHTLVVSGPAQRLAALQNKLQMAISVLVRVPRGIGVIP